MSAQSLYNRSWEKYQQFASTSRSLKAEWERWQIIFLWMTIAGTTSAALGAQSIIPLSHSSAKVCGFLGASFLAIGTFLSKELYSPSRELVWCKARAIGEAIKSDVFRFATGTPLENGKSEEADLWKRVVSLADSFTEKHMLLSPVGKNSPKVGMSLDEYVIARLGDQKNFFSGAFARADEAYAQARFIQLLIGFIVVVLGVMVGFLQSVEKINALIVLASAIAGILGSHLAAARHDFLRRSYASLSQRMGDLMAEASVHEDPKTFIVQCESELTAEHRTWLAEWHKRPTVKAPQSAETKT